MPLVKPLVLMLPKVKPGSTLFRTLVSEMHDRLGGEAPGANDSMTAKLEGHILEQCLHGFRKYDEVRRYIGVIDRDTDEERFIEAWNNVYKLITTWVQAF